MITARELVFYIRAEDQASRVVKRAAKSFGSLGNIKNLQNNAAKIQLQQASQIAKANNGIARSLSTIDRAQVAANKSAVALARAQKLDKAGKGTAFGLQNAQLTNAANLRSLEAAHKQYTLLQDDLQGIEQKSNEAAAANARLISEAQIARTQSYIGAIQGAARGVRLFGIVAGASLAYAAHQAANFSTQLTLAASQARPTGAGAGATAQIATRLQGVVLAQMQKFPASSQDMASALYNIFSSTNIQGIKQAGNFLTVLNKAAVAGGTDLGTMSEAAITLFNNFVVGGKKGGDEFNNLTGALNVFFSAVRFGRMNATQFANSLSYVSGIAKEAGLNFKDVADAMAILTRQTGASRTSQDAQGLARLIQQLSTSADIQGLKGIGVQAIDPKTNKLKPLLPLLDEISKKANLAGVNALNFFKVIGNNKGTIQAQRAFAYLTDNMAQYHKVAADVNNDNDEFQKSFIALSKSPGVEWAVFTNQLKAIVILIGTDAIPAFVKLGNYVQKAVQWFNSLSSNTKRDIGYWGTFASVIAVLGGSFVIVAGSIARFALTLKELRLASLAGEAGSVTARMGILGAAITAVAFLLIKYPHQVQGAVNALGGLHTILQSLSILILAFSVNNVIKSFTTMEAGALAAGGTVDSLRLGLLKLTLIGAITIPILIKYSSEFDKDPRNKHGVGAAINKYLGGIPVIGTAAKGGFEAGLKIDDALGLSSKAHKEAIAKAQRNANIAFSTSFGRTKELQTILTNPKQSSTTKSLARQAYTSGNFTQLNKIYAQMVTPVMKAAAKIEATNKKIKASVKAASAQKEWNDLFNNIIKLDKISSKPNATRSQIQATMDAEDKLQKISKGNQYSAAIQYLGNLESGWNKTAKAATKAADAVDKAPISQLNTRIQEVIKLRAAYQKAPSIAEHKKYYDALTKLNKDYASQSSQDYISDYLNKVASADKKAVTSHAALLKKNMQNAKTQITNLAQGISSMYDNLLSTNQAAFGTLFAGPFESGPRQQNLAQWGFKPRGSDLLKDLKSQVFQYHRFSNQLNTLKKRGASTELISQLQAIGPGADVTALRRLSPKAFKAYVTEFNKGQKLIKANTLSQLNSQLATYEKFGKKVAQAIITGVQSQDQAMQKVLTNTILTLFPGLAKQARLGGPARVNVPGHVGGNVTNWHIYGEPSAKTKTAARHAAFRARNN